MGLGTPDPAFNPFLRAELPTLAGLLGGHPPHLEHPALVPGAADPRPSHAHATRLLSLDATLGIDGLPQSGTGQVSILTGANAARRFGRHFGPWPPVALRELLRTRNVLALAQAAGHRVRFANAYPAGFPEGVSSRRVAAPPLAAHMAGVLTAGPDDLVAGGAVASEIVNDGWRRFTGRDEIPLVTPEGAGRNLAAIVGDRGLTLYAHYATDTAGHRGGMAGAVAALERVDRFLSGLLESLDSRALLVIASDHGNVEDVRVGHTRNPALGLVTGPRERVAGLALPTDLTGLAPMVLEALGAS